MKSKYLDRLSVVYSGTAYGLSMAQTILEQAGSLDEALDIIIRQIVTYSDMKNRSDEGTTQWLRLGGMITGLRSAHRTLQREKEGKPEWAT